MKVTATATIQGKQVTKNLGNLGEIQFVDKPKFVVMLAANTQGGTAKPINQTTSTGILELVMAPGSTITAILRVERNGFNGESRFDIDNLPHGVIVDNLGLSGVMVREGEHERQIFLTAAKWVPETTRWIHAVSRAQGNQASSSIKLHVQAPGQVAQSHQ